MPDNIYETLKTKIKGRTLIIGIGNDLKGDDQAGLALVRKLNPKIKAKIIECGPVPENYTKPVIEFNPETLIIVDAANWSGTPGSVKIIEPNEIGNISFSTHDASLEMLINYIKSYLGEKLNVIIIGIQPMNTGFNAGLSDSVSKAVDALAEYLEELLHA